MIGEEDKWTQAIQEVKSLITARKFNGHMRIAALATEVCEIIHGGNKEGKYTLKRFALESGIPERSLQNWVITYRNVYLKASEEQRVSLKYYHFLSAARKVNSKTKQKEVQRIIEVCRSNSDVETKILRYLGNISGLAFSLKSEEQVRLCRKEILEEVLLYLEEPKRLILKAYPKMKPKNNFINRKVSGHLSLLGNISQEIKFNETDEMIYKVFLKNKRAILSPTRIAERLPVLRKTPMARKLTALYSINKLIQGGLIKKIAKGAYTVEGRIKNYD